MTQLEFVQGLMPHSPQRQLHSIKEAQRITGLGRTKLYELIASGGLKAVKVGSRTLIPSYALDAWIDGLPKPPPCKSIKL